jgi:hypothetical protein
MRRRRVGKIARHRGHDGTESRNFAHATAPDVRRVGNAPPARAASFDAAVLTRCPPYGPSTW